MLENDSLTGSNVLSKESIVDDYRLACESRQVSLLGRKDTMGGRSKFGIFGDGKEVAQIAMARAFRRGDFRSGYYRDQTIEAALEILHGSSSLLRCMPTPIYSMNRVRVEDQ